MRTLVDIPKEDLARLTELGKENRVSRAAMIREAISACLAPRRKSDPRKVFGLWKDSPEDGLAMQERLRREWDPERNRWPLSSTPTSSSMYSTTSLLRGRK